MKSLSKKTIGIGSVVLLIIIGLGAFAGYNYYQNQKTQQELAELKKNPQAVISSETKTLLANIGKLVELPKENPTLATVTDAGKLKKQTFFAKATNGDKVLIYTEAKKAILYRPSTNKIIEIAPVNLGKEKTDVAGVQTEEPIRVALYNGTQTVGLTNTTEKQLSEKVKNVQVTAKENAAKQDYTKTLVVDISGKQEKAAGELATLLSGEVGSLPTGETKPQNVDILIILGE